MNFSPYDINLLLHCYANAAPFQQAPILEERLLKLERAGLIERNGNRYHGYRETAKGRAVIEYWCNIPNPTCKWVFE